MTRVLLVVLLSCSRPLAPLRGDVYVTPQTPAIDAVPQALPGAQIVAHITAPVPGLLYDWRVANALLVSATRAETATLTAGDAGFVLVTVNASNAQGDTATPATLLIEIVQPLLAGYQPTIETPREVIAGRKQLRAAVTNPIAGVDYSWTITTGGALAASGGTVVTYDSLVTGALTVSVRATSFDAEVNASASVQVVAGRSVDVIAGQPGGIGFLDGPTGRFFSRSTQLAVAADGTAYVSEGDLHVIRKITPEGVVSTFAGQVGVSGYEDGTNALLSSPQGLAVDDTGVLWVADAGNCVVRQITPAGVASTFAGTAGQCASTGGTRADMRLAYPTLVAVDHAGDAYVWDAATLREIKNDDSLRTIGSKGGCNTTPSLGNATFFAPMPMAIDASNDVYLPDIPVPRRIDHNTGAVSMYPPASTCLTPWSFTATAGIAVAASGVLFGLSGGAVLRFDGNLSVVAGSTGAVHGDDDGVGAAAGIGGDDYVPIGDQTSRTQQLALVGSTLIAMDNDRHRLREVDAGGAVTTRAGSLVHRGGQDGLAPTFDTPTALAVGPSGDIFVLDARERLRKVAASGEVTTLVPLIDSPGPSIAFEMGNPWPPAALAADRNGDLIVARQKQVLRLHPDGRTTPVAGGTYVSFLQEGYAPLVGFANIRDVYLASDGTLYIVDADYNQVRRLTSDGEVEIVLNVTGQADYLRDGKHSKLKAPQAVTMSDAGVLYVADTGNAVITRVVFADVLQVTDVIGAAGDARLRDGTCAEARVLAPGRMVTSDTGDLVFIDGHTLRRVHDPEGPSCAVSTLLGDTARWALTVGPWPTLLNTPSAIVRDAAHDWLLVDSAENVVFRVRD